MDRFELVLKLREKTNVSYEEAKEALEASDWDLLEAIIWLEKNQKTEEQAAADFSTQKEEYEKPKEESTKEEIKGFFNRLGSTISSSAEKGNNNFLHISRHGRTITDLPLTAVIVILLFILIFLGWSFSFLLILFILSLFFGVSYSIHGESASEAANEALRKASETVDKIKYGSNKEDNEEVSAQSSNFKED